MPNLNKVNSYTSLLKYMKPYKKEALLGFFFTMFEAILEMFVPFLMNLLLSEGIYFDNDLQKYTINSKSLLIISLIMPISSP